MDEVDKVEDAAEEFGDAFGEDEGTQPIEEPEKGEAEEEPTPDEPEEESPEEPEEEPEKPEEEKEEPATDDATAAEESSELGEFGTYEDLEQKYKTLRGMYNSEVKKEKEPPKEEEPEPEADFATEISGIAEEVSKLESVKLASDEHGEEIGKAIVDATGLIVKKVLGTMEQRQVQRFGEFSQEVKPLHEHYVNAETRAHLDTIQEAHPDFMDYVKSGELKLWVQSLGGIKKQVFEKTYSDGAASDVVDMVNEFRASKGYSEAPKEEKKDKPKKEVDTSKLEDMEAVDTKKGPVSSSKAGVSQDDFGGAFNED